MKIRSVLLIAMLINLIVPLVILGTGSTDALVSDVRNEMNLKANLLGENYNSMFSEVEKYCSIIGEKAEDVEDNQTYYKILFNPDEYFVEPRGALVATKPEEIREKSDVWVSNEIPITSEIEKTIGLSKNLDTDYKLISGKNPHLVWIYTSYENGVFRIYPYAENMKVQPSGSWDPRTYHFYTVATPENNPEKKVVWTDPYWDTAGLGWMMTCSMPLYDENGEFFGVQCIDVTLDSIIENAVSVKLGETGYVFLINEKGNVIAHPEGAKKDLNLEYKEVITTEEQIEVTNTTVLTFSLLDHPNKEFSTLVKKAIEGENVTETVKFDEKKYLTFFSIETTGWAVGVVVPVKEALAPIRNAVILAIVLAVGVCLAISVIIARRVAKLIINLSQTSDKITKGDLSARADIQTSIEEFNSLARDTNQMVDSLEQSKTRLKNRLELMEKLVKKYEEYIGPVAKTIAKSIMEEKEDK